MKNIYVEKNRKARHDINRAVIATMKFSEKYTLSFVDSLVPAWICWGDWLSLLAVIKLLMM
jgi:hypothetical protein